MGQKKTKFAFIGCGRVSGRHAEAVNAAPNAELVAVCDLELDKAKARGEENKVPYYTNYHEMIKKHPEVDVVSIITPSGSHFEHAADIITRYKKHVMVEKPMVMQISQGRSLKKIAAENSVRIFPIFQNRFNKAVQFVKNSMGENGDLGKLRVGTVRMRWCRPQRYYDQGTWRATWAMDGGALTNQGIHYIDLLRYLCGEPKRLNSVLATLGAKIAVEDTAVATLEFESGALGVIEVMTSARDKDYEASISCVCEKGLAVIGGWATNELITYSPKSEVLPMHSEEFPTIYGFGHNAMVKAIAESLQNGKPAPIEYDDAFNTVKLLHAIYRSDEIKNWVDLASEQESTRLGRPDEALYNLYRTPPPAV